jgi:hypothetical protein
MSVNISGTAGVTTPALILTGASGSVTLVGPASGTGYVAQLPSSSGTLLLSSSVNGSIELISPLGGTLYLVPPNIATNSTITFPTTAGSAGQFLQTDGAGVTTWANGGGGGGGNLTIGTSTISGGTSGSILINTTGVLQQIVMGTGVASALAIPTGSGSGFATLTAGAIPVTQGGTGATSVTGAQAALFPTQTPADAGKVLKTDGFGTLSWVSNDTGLVVNSSTITSGAPFGVFYQNGGVLGQLANGVTGQVLSANTANAPSWIAGNVTVGSTQIPIGGSAINITGVQSLTLTQDAVNGFEVPTKNYVDAATSAVNRIAPVEVATTANIALTGAQTIDGVSITGGERVLVKNQTAASGNGVYVAAAGAWTRASDANTWNKLVAALVFVQQGTTQASTTYIQTAPAGGTLGTTPVTWVIQSGPVSYIAGTGISITGGTTINNTGVVTFSAGTTGLSPAIASSGAITLSGILNVSNGGTGLGALGTGVQSALANPINAAGGFSVLNGFGYLPISQGGTGATTVQGAQASLLPNQVGQFNKVLATDGVNTLSWVSNDAGLVVGSTTISSGTTNSLLYQNGLVLGEITMGTGVQAALGLAVGSANGFLTIGASTPTTRGVLIAGAGGTINSTAAGLSGQVLQGAGAGADPVWSYNPTFGSQGGTQGSIVLANTGTGSVTIQSSNSNTAAYTLTLPVSAGTSGQVLATNGSGVLSWVSNSAQLDIGTPVNSGTIGGVLVQDTSNNLAEVVPGTAGQILTSAGAGAIPAWTTATYPSTTTVNQILYSSAANVVAGLATANGGVLNTDSAGNPIITATPTLGVAGTTAGTLALSGSTAGTVTLQSQASASGTITLPNGNATLLASSSALTQGSVVFAGASGVMTQDNANFFWDDTNNRLGIGTNTPTKGLQLVGSDALVNGLTVGRGGGAIATNTVVGNGAQAASGGTNNVAVGDSALAANTATGNTAVGSGALTTNTSGDQNNAFGRAALLSNTTGARNVAVGNSSQFNNLSGSDNVSVGIGALGANTTSSNNIAIGTSSLANNTAGPNTAVGYNSLSLNTTGTNNVAVGDNALDSSTGNGNVALGSGAGSALTSGNNNVYLGGYVGNATESGMVYLSNGSGTLYGAFNANGSYFVTPTAAASGTAPGSLVQAGYLNIPQNSQTTGYTTVLNDSGKHILCTSSGGTYTIPSNGSVAYTIGTVITFVNSSAGNVTIACSDTMTLAGTATTGSRTLAANGLATAIKIGATSWIINGAGLT